MSRYEFIETLRSVLNRSLTPSQVTEHVNYYEEYIRSRVAAGENERAVLTSLGDPRLIARTILEAGECSSSASRTAYRETDASDADAYSYGNYRNEVDRGSSGRTDVRVRHQLPTWLVWILIIGIIILVLGLVVSVVSFLVPLLIPALVVIFLVKLFRDWLN